MEPMTALKTLPIIGSIYDRTIDWYKGPTVEVTTQRVFAHYDRLSGQPYKPIDFQVRVENRGRRTVYDLRGNIYFRGTIGSGEHQGTIIVDTRGTWDQKENPGISLHGGEAEWLNVLRVVQDYTKGYNFDLATDVYLIFPTNKGWDQPSRIRQKWSQNPTTLTKDKITLKTAKELVWQEARIEIIGEDKKSNEVSFVYDIDLVDLRDKMDNRATFFMS